MLFLLNKTNKYGRGALWAFLMLTVGSGAVHAEYVALDFYNTYVENAVVPLKREIRLRYPRLNLRNYRLDRVEVTAHGRGRVKLYVDGHKSDSVRVWARHRSKSYALRHRGDRRGKWQLEVSGRAKVSYIYVYFSPRRVHVAPSHGGRPGSSGGSAGQPSAQQGGGWQLQTYCNCRTNKRCYIRYRDGQREVGTCVYDCPNGCKQ